MTDQPEAVDIDPAVIDAFMFNRIATDPRIARVQLIRTSRDPDADVFFALSAYRTPNSPIPAAKHWRAPLWVALVEAQLWIRELDA